MTSHFKDEQRIAPQFELVLPETIPQETKKIKLIDVKGEKGLGLRRRKKILIVDGEPDILGTLKEILGLFYRHGCRSWNGLKAS